MTWVYRGEMKAETKIDVGSVPNEAETHLLFYFFTVHSLLVFYGHCVAPLSTDRGEVPDSAKGFHCPVFTTMALPWFSTSQGLNLCPLYWKYGILTTGPPGKSQDGSAFELGEKMQGISSSCLLVILSSGCGFWLLHDGDVIWRGQVYKCKVRVLEDRLLWKKSSPWGVPCTHGREAGSRNLISDLRMAGVLCEVDGR